MEVFAEEILDLLGPTGKQVVQNGADEDWVELPGVLGTRQKADNRPHDDGPHAWDCAKPHVRNLIDFDVGKFVSVNKANGYSDKSNARLGLSQY